MVIKDASLEIIATRRSQYPEDGKPEFLLVGRSNVGKSSFINAILSRKNLAYTSSRPGKTQTLNFYYVNNSYKTTAQETLKFKDSTDDAISIFTSLVEKSINSSLRFTVNFSLGRFPEIKSPILSFFGKKSKTLPQSLQIKWE